MSQQNGYLFVYADPGSGVAEEEFNDWYDNEHIPLRIEIPSFSSWQRWKAVDGEKPTWAASYDLTSYRATLESPYSDLANTRSEREKKIIADLGLLERRTYEEYEGQVPKPSALYDPTKPAPFAVFVSTDVHPGTEEEFNKWYDEEHSPLISTVPGWIRSRRFVLKDWSRGGVEGSKDQSPPPQFLAVHEYANFDEARKPETVTKLHGTPWAKKVNGEVVARRSLRRFQLHKTWERK